MVTTTFPIRNLHLEYKLWIVELTFYEEMIRIFENHLEHIVAQNRAHKDVLSQVEHFQNQFIREKEVIDELKHDLNVSEKQLASFTHEMIGIGYEFERLDNHPKLRDEFLIFKKIFSELKDEFHKFEEDNI